MLNGISGSTTLTVTPSVLVSIAVTPANPTLSAGFTQQFTATGTFSDGTTENLTSQVTWISSSGAVAAISNSPGSQGLAAGLSPGSTTLTAMLHGVSGSTTLTVTSAVLVSIAVTPANPTLSAGFPQQFTATGTFSDSTTENLTDEVTWISANVAIAAISNSPGSQGLAKGLRQGSTTITAMLMGISGQTTMTVTCPAITITTGSELPEGTIFRNYDVQLQTAGGIQPIIFSLVSGSLPSGLTLTSSGRISGRIEANFGDYNFTIQAVSNCGTSTTKGFSMFVLFPPP